MTFLDGFDGTVVQVVQNGNILSSFGKSFFVYADLWKQRWFLSSFFPSNSTFDDIPCSIPIESQNCHGSFDGLRHQQDFDRKPLKHERESTMR